MLRGARSQGTWLLTFFFVNSLAEIVQGIGMLWITYDLTHDALKVGVMNAAAYLPGVLVGLVFQRRADAGRASTLLALTNWVLLAGSLVLALVWVAEVAVSTVLVCFIGAQCSLSVVKMLNKAYVGRFVRDRFGPREATRLLGRATSLALVGGLVGGAVAGVLLDAGAAGWCFAVAALLYGVSLLAVRRAAHRPGPRRVHDVGRSAAGDIDGERTPHQLRGALWLILLFSIPSSGALPFLSTVMVPLASDIAPNVGFYYSILSMAATLGGFLAGVLVSSGRVSLAVVLRYALPVSSVLTGLFMLVRWAPLVAVLMVVAVLVMTSHVIVMQVLTNQAPEPGEVGRFAVLRNSVAGASKGGFSLLAGWLVEAGGGLGSAWAGLGSMLALFAVLWWVLSRRSVRVRAIGVD